MVRPSIPLRGIYDCTATDDNVCMRQQGCHIYMYCQYGDCDDYDDDALTCMSFVVHPGDDSQ